MKRTPLSTVLIGFGKIGAMYADDPVMRQYYRYSTHAQVLAEHPDFSWDAVVDLSDEALEHARTKWGIRHTANSIDELVKTYDPEVAVVATPPQHRASILKSLPNLKAILVEKPIGTGLQSTEEFVTHCRQHAIKVQVNLWRRADSAFRDLASGGIEARIGRPQAVFCVYGNGLLNNGTHMIDFVRMLFGEIESVKLLLPPKVLTDSPIQGDVAACFAIVMRSGLVVNFQPIDFKHYRENAIDIWGERGYISIRQEGLLMRVSPVRPNRAMTGEREVATDEWKDIESTVGTAFYDMYTNLADSLFSGVPLCSSLYSALETERIVEEIRNSRCLIATF